MTRNNNTAARLNAALNAKHLKQVDVARKTGISKGTIAHYFAGDYAPKYDKLEKIAAALGVSPDWLMGKDVPPENTALPRLIREQNESRLLAAYYAADDKTKKIVLQLLDLEGMQL